jgi:transposase
MIPAQIWVQKNIYPKYACQHCQGLSDESTPAVKTAERTPDLIARSIITPELLAYIWTAKFCDHLPYYRQEAGFTRIGAEISRQDMVNWTLKVTGRITPLMDLIDDHIRSGEVIQQDETPVKVLELDRTGKAGQGYMWLARGGPPERKAVRYRFADGRGHEHPKTYLTGFSGYHQSDAFAAYDLAAVGTDIKLVGCWAHARRKFMDAVKASKSSGAEDALGRIKKLYHLEKESRELARQESLAPWEFQKRRKEIIGPYLEGLKTWMEKKALETLQESAFGKALSYTLGQWEKLERYLDHPELTPDNNLAENAIRPFVLGRKNWLFSGNDRGAEASCRVFTLIETAKLNGWEPFAYLRTMLTRLPTIGNDWNGLLPWNLKPGTF